MGHRRGTSRRIQRHRVHRRISILSHRQHVLHRTTGVLNSFSREIRTVRNNSTHSVFRLQVFHCTKQAETGGDTLLLDGFKAAQLLKEHNNQFYEALISTPIEWQYIAGDHHLTHVAKILRTREFSDELEQIRYSYNK